MIPVVKHFPGLGGESQNTDVGPATTLRWSLLEKTGLVPFVDAIDSGVPAVMVSNASVPASPRGRRACRRLARDVAFASEAAL